MLGQIVVISGPISAGKTTLAARLQEDGFAIVKTHELIGRETSRKLATREDFQRAGDRLDRRTRFEWIANTIRRFPGYSPEARLIVDAVRKPEQLVVLRRAFGDRIFHLHLKAPDDVLEERYQARKSAVKELPSYADARKNVTERRIGRLEPLADAVVDTSRSTHADVLTRARCHLGLYGDAHQRLVDVLIGGQYGSEGKGQVAAYLASEYEYLVRVGGPNAGHKVFAEPEPHTFHHLPSGTMKSEAKLILGPGAVIWPEGLQEEIVRYSVTHDRLSIDPQAMIIEASDRDIEEETLRREIASTAQGVGLATSRKILRAEAKPKVRLARDVRAFRPYIRPTRELLDRAFAERRKVFIEGTQGTELSIHHGAYPYVTSRDTSVSGCLADVGVSPSRVRKVILVCRTYPIRVGGKSGELQQEIDWEAVSERSRVPITDLKKTEKTTTTKRDRRVGEFEWTTLRKSASLNTPTDIALTFVDYIDIKNRNARRFEQLTTPTIHFIEEIERVGGAPVSLISTRFHDRSIIDRRHW
jgi:adenylosuccinate synthase